MNQCNQCLNPNQKGVCTCANQAFEPANPMDQLRRKVAESAPAFDRFYGQSPIKVFTVCIDKDSDKHLAFLGSDPSKKYTAFRTYNAVLGLLIQEKVVSVDELEP